MAELGWFIASVYVICGALRLARFNCLSAMQDENKDEKVDEGDSSEFVGFPIPAAAGLVASITYFLIWFESVILLRELVLCRFYCSFSRQ